MPEYNHAHRKARAKTKAKVDVEGYVCSRCGRQRPPGSAFELDHADDGINYLGPSCVLCNRAAGGVKGRRNDRLRRIRTRNW